MSFSEFILIPLKSISPSVTCWVVKVQVSKLRKIVDHVNGKTIGKLKMILFDSELGSYYVYKVSRCGMPEPDFVDIGAKTVAKSLAIENAKMIITQHAPQPTIIEWIKKQQEDLRSQGFGGSRNHVD
ncbi:hypothetical protein JHK85_010573 [Glycine max]|nr:hypothetical protein JHK85_010573 [Glycine max]